MTSATVIETKGLTKTYAGVKAVNDLTFSIKRGEVVGFVGLNGAGKSTTINILLGFLHPTGGEVCLFGETVAPQNAQKSHQRIGFATGDMSLFDGMTGRQYLGYVLRAYRIKDRTTFNSLSHRFEPQLDKKMSDLSRGNKQKIALIAAFMINPEVVILDEPSSGLDPLMQQHFLELVREQADKGTTIFMSSHYLNEVIDVCTRVLLIKDGKLVKDVPTSKLNASAGKWVRVATTHEVKPPKNAELVKHEKMTGGYVIEFIYKDKALRLQEWVSGLSGLQDLTIEDHNPEAAFEDLYEVKEASNV